jgi:hypothetical protein
MKQRSRRFASFLRSSRAVRVRGVHQLHVLDWSVDAVVLKQQPPPKPITTTVIDGK